MFKYLYTYIYLYIGLYNLLILNDKLSISHLRFMDILSGSNVFTLNNQRFNYFVVAFIGLNLEKYVFQLIVIFILW